MADGQAGTTEAEVVAVVMTTMTLLLHTTISLNLDRKSPSQEDQDSGRERQLEVPLVEQPDMRWVGDTTHNTTGTREQDHHIPGAMIMVIGMIQVRLQGHRSLSPRLGPIRVLDLLDEGERGKARLTCL